MSCNVVLQDISVPGQQMLLRNSRGTLQENISRALPDAEEWILDKVTTGAGRVVTRAQNSLAGARVGGLPATRHGTRGFSKLFNRLHFVESI